MGMAGKAGPSIEGRRNGPGEPAAGSAAGVFDPFYERLARRLPDALMPKVSLPLAVALAYYTVHRLVFKESWAAALYPELLALVIFVIPLLVYLATGMFDELFEQMNNRVSTGRPPAYRATLARHLSDRRFLLATAVFGLASVAVATVLGIRLDTPSQTYVVTAGYFLAGALCGLALWGIIGIVHTIRVYVREDRPRYDVTAPDGCGGMLFLGRAITKFGILAMIGGVLVSSYLLLADSQVHVSNGPPPAESQVHVSNGPPPAESQVHVSNGPPPEESQVNGEDGHIAEDWEVILLWGLVAVPYIFSALVLLAPTFEIHYGLHAYKVDEDRRIEDILKGLEAEIRKAGADVEQLQALHFRRDDTRERRRMLYAMSSWPFSLDTHLKYAVLVALNGALTLFSASSGRLKQILSALVP